MKPFTPGLYDKDSAQGGQGVLSGGKGQWTRGLSLWTVGSELICRVAMFCVQLVQGQTLANQCAQVKHISDRMIGH